MNKTIEDLKKTRKDIIATFSSKNINATYIDEYIKNDKELQYVIVKEIKEETKDTKSFILIPDKNKGTNSLSPFKAGEYISIKVGFKDVYTTRAYSLSSNPANLDYYRITVKRVDKGIVSNYMLDTIKAGDSLIISRPAGNFGYNKIRDAKNVIAIAGGSGITPFISLAHAIESNIEDCNLTVIYSVKTENDIIFKDEIVNFNKKSKKVKFIITLTREQKEGYLNGHITKEMIEPYIKEENTILMCGPKAIYKAMNEILSSFQIPKKSVHYESFNIEYNETNVNSYELKVILKNDFVLTKCQSNETLLVAMEKAGITAPSLCRVGECGFCRSILLEGKVKMIGGSQREAEKASDYIHPCISYPQTNIVLRIDI